MFQSMMLQQLRSMRLPAHVDLKPITMLLGANSSGKSSFLRFLPLLKQSTEVRTMGPILWNGRLVDFGSFQEAVSYDNDAIIFGFNINLPTAEVSQSIFFSPFPGTMMPSGALLIQPDIMQVTVKVGLDRKGDFTIIREFSVTFSDQMIRLQFDNESKLVSFRINGTDRIEWFGQISNTGGGQTPSLRADLDPGRRTLGSLPNELGGYSLHTRLYQNLVSSMKKYVRRGTDNTKFQELIYHFGIGSSESMLYNLQNVPVRADIWKRNTYTWSVDSADFHEIRDKVIAFKVPFLFSQIDDYFREFFLNIYYLEPVRATAQRYYRRQDISVAEVDSSGQNLAMFIRNLSESERRQFSQWIEESFGFGLRIQPSGSGHISLTLRERGGGRDVNIADTGFGFSQVLPILTQLWTVTSRKQSRGVRRKQSTITFAIEQPELHLHPRLQAILADTFASALRAAKHSGIDLRIILETHSETIVSRFGQMITKGKFDSNDVGLSLFERISGETSTEITAAKYNDQGILVNWPYGFFEPEVIK